MTPYHVRLLIDDPWFGGKGFPLDSVAEMSIDQILMSLADRKQLQSRERSVPSEMAAAIPQKDGLVSGRSEDGSPMQAKIVGKSRARQLMEAAQAREEAAKQAAATPKRRRRRGK